MTQKRKLNNPKAVRQYNDNMKLLDELVKQIIDSSPKHLLVVSENKIVYCNAMAVGLLGYSKKALRRKSLTDLIISDQGSLQLNQLLAKSISLKNDQVSEGRLNIVAKNGEEILISPSIHRFLWEGKPSVLINLRIEAKSNDVFTNGAGGIELFLIAQKIAKQYIWDYYLKTDKLEVSPNFNNLLNYHEGKEIETIEMWEGLLHPKSREAFRAILLTLKEKGELPNSWEYRISTGSGKYTWFAANWQIVEWDDQGKPLRLLGVHMDVNLKKSDQLFKEEYQKTLQGYISNSLDGFGLIDERGIVREWNSVLEQITHIRREEVLNLFISDVKSSFEQNQRPEKGFMTELCEFHCTIAHKGTNPWQGQLVETTLRSTIHEKKILQHSLFMIETESGNKLAITTRDVTESKTAQLKVEKSEERLKLALNAGNLGIWDVDLISGEKHFSPMTFTIFGYRPYEIVPDESLTGKLVHPSDVDWLKQKVAELRYNGSMLEVEFRAKKKEGTYIWVLSKNQIIRDENNKPIRAIGTISDITRQKNTETELRRNEEILLKNLKQHELLSEISYILNTNKGFSLKNNEVIKLIGSFINCSRVYIFENKPEDDLMVNTYEWCNKDIEPQIQNLQKIPLSKQFEWTRGSNLTMSWDLEKDLVPDFAEFLRKQDIQSFVIIPLQVTGKLFGYIGFDECNHPRKWRKEELELLKTISNLLSFSFEREQIIEHYKLNEKRYRELTDELPQVIFEVSSKGQIDFLNQIGCETFGFVKNDVVKGLSIWNIASLREVAKLKSMRGNILKAKNPEPLKVTLKTVSSFKKEFSIHLRPRMEQGQIINFSGIAL